MSKIVEVNKPVDYRGVLPDDLTLGDITNARRFLESVSLEDLNEWTEKRTQIYTNRDDHRFRMVVDQPSDGNRNKAVLVLSEFGTGVFPRLVAKSRVIRDAVDPEATLVIQPSSIIGEPNMNYSWAERVRLADGDLAPTIGRIALTMESLGNPEDVTIFGPSQGAMIGLGYAADDRTRPVALSVVEIPNLVERDSVQLMWDFKCSGRDLPQVVRANFINHEAPLAVLFERDVVSKLNLARFVLSSLHPDNIAMISAMCHAKDEPAMIDTILKKGGSVVHAWGDQDHVSSVTFNRYISSIEQFQNNPRYASRVLRGMGHAATDFYALDGALARLAHRNFQSK